MYGETRARAGGETAGSCGAYALFGLVIDTELALPGFAEAAGGPADVVVRFAAVPSLGQKLAVLEDGALQLEVADVGRYRIAGGREILIDPAPGASERNLRVYLLGSAFGALLHQRGLLPLHANAVEIAGSAVAFVGHSGAGKSTLAAWFMDRSYPVLCDDVCAVTLAEADCAPLVHPGVPRLRLWEDALARSGRDRAAFARSFDGQDKFDVPAGRPVEAGPRPLAACYLLERAAAGSESGSVELLGSMDALEALVANTYRGGFARLLGGTERHLRLCMAVAKRVPVYRAARQWSIATFDAEARRLESHARQLIERFGR
jgi:hypothetical protein